jgi:membrane fusion protein (multidrug efflux system)
MLGAFMKKSRMTIMLICVGTLFGSIFLYKIVVGFIIKNSLSNQVRIIPVSSMKVTNSDWEPTLKASVSMRAIRGVNVTTELPGMVQTIYFKPGAEAKENEVLVQLNADNEIAQLNALKANAELAKTTYLRDKAQYNIHAISKQVLDNDAANLKSLEAQVAQQAAIVNKKSIKAPFAGNLGINRVNPGQFLNPGDNVVSLQMLDPLYVDFFLPQQMVSELKIGQKVIVTSDATPNKSFEGTITTIDPAVDVATRNIAVEATVANPKHELMPGMFGHVEIILGEARAFITVPQTAISFNPYGDLIYIIKKSGEDKKGTPILIAKQHFVTTGETRGEQIKVLKGLNVGDEIVTSGQLKLKNGSRVSINNSIEPSNNPQPLLSNDH